MEGGNSASDLQALLATLSQYGPRAATATSTQEQYGGMVASSATPQELQSAIATPPPGEKAKDPRLRPQSRSAPASPKPMIDPATITVWQEGLRCVTKIAAQNAQFAASIKRMMQDQKAHEMRWYTERQNLKQTQANRPVSAAKAQLILKSLNTNMLDSLATPEPPEVDKEAELAEFDRKIYSAQQTMETAMTAELKGLGVPFFGTDRSLVVSDGHDVSEDRLPDGQPKWSPTVTESQLLELKRKMVSHLEDLYRE